MNLGNCLELKDLITQNKTFGVTHLILIQCEFGNRINRYTLN